MHVNSVTRGNTPIARLALAGFLGCAMLRAAAADVIDTNRPGFSFTPSVVDRQTLQIETALTYLRSDGGLRQLSLPNAELRYGIGHDVEVFVSGINWNDAEFGSANASGLGDISFGTKIGLDISGEKLSSAVLFLVSAPVGDDEFTSDRWDPSLGFVWTYSGRIPLAGTARITDRDDGLGFDNGLKLPVQVDERQTVFVEWEANFPARGSNSHWLNSGYQRLLSDDIQIDVAIDFSLSEFGDDYRFGVGFSTRF